MEGMVKINLDADHQGHLLVMLSEYHAVVKESWYSGEMDDEAMCDNCYLIGNLEGRVHCNSVTLQDMALMAYWEDDVKQWKENHDGQIVIYGGRTKG